VDSPSRVTPIICKLPQASVPDLVEIEAESNRPPWSKKLFQQEFSNHCAQIYGARVSGQLAGFLVVHVIVDEAHIVNFGVRNTLRSQGIGRALITQVLLELHQSAVKWVTLEVRKGNRIARTLYSSLGFIEVGERPGYYVDNQEDAIVMSLSVDEFSARSDLAEFAGAVNS
jgi:[ribosomal protein S18]-alanine N-acetyltransferase